ncbi:hypothetical protein NKW84_10140 [Acetobacter senegalensis]|uniref:hypothetical protein n=1 Tax=Acetobacter senegalensis TaxID=446692 RepID=UPI00209D955A|nr:hypothetical protein [Acetobacter senegalensis]MCP1196217.1 hypothetical protein [Acetobacter senegalensis]
MSYYLHLDAWTVENDPMQEGVHISASFRLRPLGKSPDAPPLPEGKAIAVTAGNVKIDFHRNNANGITQEELLQVAQAALSEAKLSHSS